MTEINEIEERDAEILRYMDGLRKVDFRASLIHERTAKKYFDGDRAAFRAWQDADETRVVDD